MSETTKQKAREAAEALRETGESALIDARGAAARTAQSVRESATDAARTVKETVGETAEHMRKSAADQGEKAASALRDRADGMDADSVQRRVLDSVASGMDSLSSRVRDGNINQLFSDAEAFARRNPLLFIAGAALAGFAIARMTQSRGDRDEAL